MTNIHVLNTRRDTGALVMSKADIAKARGQAHAAVIRDAHLVTSDSGNMARE